MRYLSVCSGIEAATVAWHPLGWQPVGFSEIEKFPSQVLGHHYGSNMPGEAYATNGVPNYGDMTRFEEWPDHAIDLLVGGTPCQSFSVAGLRKGLADPRGNLMLTYLAIARRYQPRWLVWENVPGVLSSNGGGDFGTFIRGLEECGYHAAWRVLDAQYVRVDGYPRAVPQRRRRVFVVGYLGDWRRAAAVLLEREGLRWDTPPRREPGKRVAPTISSRPTGGGGLGTDFDLDGGLIQADWPAEVSPTLDTFYGDKMGLEDQHVFNQRGGKFVPAIAFGWQNSESQGISASDEITPTLDKSKTPAVAWSIMPQNSGKDYKARPVEVAQPLMAGGPVGGNQGGDYIQEAWAVRRLTPTECERLQGFPDGYTDIMPNGKPTPDGPRYKALGNSMAVNCMRWIGRRIQHVEAITSSMQEAA